MATGGCHCGAVRYEVTQEAVHSTLCHCADCRLATGAHAVGWALFPLAAVKIVGETTDYRSSVDVIRSFCGVCGTSLFYTNPAVFPGMVDIQSATLDDQDAFPPTAHIQCADAPAWMKHQHELPKFDRYPA